jgi:hypothetical protein
MNCCIKFKDLIRLIVLYGLNKAYVQRFCIGILEDLFLAVIPGRQAVLQDIRPTTEHNDAVAGKQVSNMSFHKSINRNKFRRPPINIDNPGIPFHIITGHIRCDCIG